MDVAHNKTAECSNRGLCDRYNSLTQLLTTNYVTNSLTHSLAEILANANVLVDIPVIRVKDSPVGTQTVTDMASA